MFCSLFITSLFGHQTLTGRDDTPATRSFRVDLFSFRFISILLIGRNECVIRFVFCLFFIQSSLASPSTVAHRRSCLMFDTLSPKLNVIVFFFSFFYLEISCGQFYDCRNHVRVIQPMGDGSRLYVCGTNAHNPKDWVINVSLISFFSITPKFQIVKKNPVRNR